VRAKEKANGPVREEVYTREGGWGGVQGGREGGEGRRVGKEVRDCYVQESIAGLAH
jgi:hypothetical protein